MTHTNAKRAATGETVRDPRNADQAGGSIGTSFSSIPTAKQQVTTPRIDGAGIQLAKSSLQNSEVFTNCGKPDDQEEPVRPARKKLTRVPFTVSRLMEFCTRRELVNQTGHDMSEWPLVVCKELVDNSLDACEEAEVAPVISITVNSDSIAIEDNGPGLPAKTIESVLDYSIRVSSREAYASPTRGAQGNALKTILPMGYVLDERHGEEASGETIIEAPHRVRRRSHPARAEDHANRGAVADNPRDQDHGQVARSQMVFRRDHLSH